MNSSEEESKHKQSNDHMNGQDAPNSLAGKTNRWVEIIGIFIAAILTPVVTIYNTVRVELINREVDIVRYFQQEIKSSHEHLAGADPEQARVALASLYSLANDYDKKRVLISIALSRDSEDLDKAISYLILSENEDARSKIIANNSSLREAARRIDSDWVMAYYEELEGVESNADIRPQITNASTQLLQWAGYSLVVSPEMPTTI